MLEKALIERPGYEEYIKRTSAFVPWFPKNPAR
jgi:steroid 5-alpha reductase family enzyme